MPGVRDAVQKATDDAFCEGVKQLYAAAIAKVSGGESIQDAMKQFNAGLVLEVCKLHTAITADIDKVLSENGVT